MQYALPRQTSVGQLYLITSADTMVGGFSGQVKPALLW